MDVQFRCLEKTLPLPRNSGRLDVGEQRMLSPGLLPEDPNTGSPADHQRFHQRHSKSIVLGADHMGVKASSDLGLIARGIRQMTWECVSRSHVCFLNPKSSEGSIVF